jgi:hypothetical protein
MQEPDTDGFTEFFSNHSTLMRWHGTWSRILHKNSPHNAARERKPIMEAKRNNETATNRPESAERGVATNRRLARRLRRRSRIQSFARARIAA